MRKLNRGGNFSVLDLEASTKGFTPRLSFCMNTCIRRCPQTLDQKDSLLDLLTVTISVTKAIELLNSFNQKGLTQAIPMRLGLKLTKEQCPSDADQ